MAQATQPLQRTSALLRLDRATGTLKERRFRVSVVSGPDAGTVLDFDGIVVIGTHPDAGLTLKDTTISRYHVELTARPDGVRVRDLESTNGTYLGGTRIAEVIVEEEATISLGKTVLKVGMTEADLGKPAEQASFGPAVGAAPVMKQLFGILDRVSTSTPRCCCSARPARARRCMARAIHERSRRAAGPSWWSTAARSRQRSSRASCSAT